MSEEIIKNPSWFSSEMVTDGHPDKIMDTIVDKLLNKAMQIDPKTRTAFESAGGKNTIMVFGETSLNVSDEELNNMIDSTVAEVYHNLGEDEEARELQVIHNVNKQSSDISDMVIGDGKVKGAGDQGMMFGYASRDTKSMMPYGYDLARRLIEQLEAVRKSGKIPYIRADGKAIVTLDYDTNVIKDIFISTRHKPVDLQVLRKDVFEQVIKPVLANDENLLDGNNGFKHWVQNIQFHVNEAGKFEIGGIMGDAGLTGRKIIVDTYGGYARHGGGAFSGKDSSKVDRSGAYMARWIAKNLLNGLPQQFRDIEVQISYGIGKEQPLGLTITSPSTPMSAKDKTELENAVMNSIDLSPQGIIDRFNLQSPIYDNLGYNGHFGRTDIDLPWEQIDPNFLRG